MMIGARAVLAAAIAAFAELEPMTFTAGSAQPASLQYAKSSFTAVPVRTPGLSLSLSIAEILLSSDEQEREECRQIGDGDAEKAPRPRVVAGTEEPQRAPAQHERAEERRAGEVHAAAETQRDQDQRGHDLEHEPDEDRPPRRLLAALVGQDLQPGRQVVAAPEERDGEKMRDLPEEDDAEEREARRRQRPGAGGPAEERRHRARDGADEERVHRPLLHRRVDQHVEEERDGAEEPGQRVVTEDEDGNADQPLQDS